MTPLGVWIAIIFVCLVLIVFVVAVVFGGLDVEAGSPKWFTLKMTKRQKNLATHPDQTHTEPVAEPAMLTADQPLGVLHEPVPQEPEENENEEGEGLSHDTFFQYISTRSLDTLDSSFQEFIPTVDQKSVEFWQTDYVRRREKLGADRAREAMRDLAAQQPNWAYPHAVLLDWALVDHDLVEAKRHLDAGLTKTQSPQFGYVLSAGVRLIFRAEGKHAALEFATQWSKADLTESIRAGAFVTLADLLENTGDTDGYRVALEFADALQPSNVGRAFSLAYSYAEANARWGPAIWHYQRCLGPEGDGPIARNNVGIIYRQIDKAVAIQTYERANDDGDKYAAANIAHLLIEDGYVSIAQTLLDGVQDLGNAAENHASARTAALTARRRAEGKLKEITDAARADVEPYKASLAAALRNLQRNDFTPIAGWFASADRKAIALLDSEKALCQLRIGTLVFEGALQNQAVCFAGWLSTKGASLLGSDVGQFTLLNEGDGILRLFRWPTAVGLQNRVEAYELRQTEAAPELAPPPPPPPPPPTPITNALLQAIRQP